MQKNIFSELNIEFLLSSSKLPVPELISVNFHITNVCNYHCKFCFAHFSNEKLFISVDDAKKIILDLKLAGTEKITFVGGEPILHPNLGELLEYSKSLKLITCIVSNGSLIDDQFLNKYHESIDWIGLSIDSSDFYTEVELGRTTMKNFDHVNHIKRLVPKIRKYNIKIKINVVVTKLNYQQDMSDSLTKISPERLKLFKVLPIEGENDNYINQLHITDREFADFVSRHEKNKPIAENNDFMTKSYIMIDPKGRFFDNSSGILLYSKPIVEVGVEEAFKQVSFSLEKLIEREGLYDWNNEIEETSQMITKGV